MARRMAGMVEPSAHRSGEAGTADMLPHVACEKGYESAVKCGRFVRSCGKWRRNPQLRIRTFRKSFAGRVCGPGLRRNCMAWVERTAIEKFGRRAGVLALVVAIGFSAAPVVAEPFEESVERSKKIPWPNQVSSNAIKKTVFILAGSGYATGVFIEGRTISNHKIGLVITNRHVVQDHGRVEVIFLFCGNNGSDCRFDRQWYSENKKKLVKMGYYTHGQTVVVSKDYDLAVVEIRDFPERVRDIKTEFSYCSELANGDPLYIVGNPRGRDLWHRVAGHFVDCVVPEKEAVWTVEKVMRIEATTDLGNSGGPVLDKNGRLVGIVSWVGEMWTIAIPADAVVLGSSFLIFMHVSVIKNSTDLDVNYILEWKERNRWNEQSYLGRHRGTIGSGRRMAFMASNSVSEIQIRFSDEDGSRFYRLDFFPNIVGSLPIVFDFNFESLDHPAREIRIQEYEIERRGPQLGLLNSGVNGYKLDKMSNEITGLVLHNGNAVNPDEL